MSTMTPIKHWMMAGIISAARITRTPALLVGPTGVGKTMGLRSYAAENQIAFHEVRASQLDSHNMTGIYVPNHATQKTSAYPCTDWPTEDNVAAGVFPPHGIMVIEELLNSSLHVAPLLYQALNEGEIGRHKIAPGWTLFATGNRLEDRSGVRVMLSAELNRLAAYLLLCEFNDWIDWAIKNKIRPEIVSYFAGEPDQLNESEILEVDPNDQQKQRRRAIPPNSQFASPRSVTKLSREIDAWVSGGGYPPLQVFEAFVGTRIAGPLSAWAASLPDMPTWREIVADPLKARQPTTLQGRYYTMSMAAQQVDRKTTGQFARYFRQLGSQEITSSAWRLAELACPDVVNTPEYAAHKAGVTGSTP